jgi:predicted nucleic acid-binding protein
VSTFLAERFAEPPLVLPARAYLELVQAAARTGLAGGSVYDALIAATTRHAGATLLSRDQRARPVYDRMKVDYTFLD